MYLSNSTDPLFRNFLQPNMARIVVLKILFSVQKTSAIDYSDEKGLLKNIVVFKMTGHTKGFVRQRREEND